MKNISYICGNSDRVRWLTMVATGLIASLVPAIAVQATPIELGLFKSIDQAEATCPDRVLVTEESKPYEGGYTVNGQAKLNRIAGPFTVAATDPFSVTWVATLKPEYRRCRATGRIVKDGSERVDRHSHLRLRVLNGKVFLILDMTGMSDANGFTPAILKKGVTAGNPTWSWGGTD